MRHGHAARQAHRPLSIAVPPTAASGLGSCRRKHAARGRATISVAGSGRRRDGASVRWVSALSIRRRLRRQRRWLTVIATVLALAGVIALHHSGLVMSTHHDMGISAIAEMCLGVFTAVGAAVAAIGLAIIALGRWRPAPIMLPVAPLATQPAPPAQARHGPHLLSLLCVSRR